MTLRCEIDGQTVAARWHEGRDGQARAVSLTARSAWLSEAGIATTGLTKVIHVDDPIGAWSVSPWCEGTLGARMIGDPVDGPGLAAAMGALSARISSLPSEDTDALALDDRWGSPATLAAAAEGWLADVAEALDSRTRHALAGSIGQILGRDEPWRMAVVHGDLVPINVILTPDGSMAVLDLEHMAVGPPTLDPAWWGWVVRFHHPDAWRATWPTFRAATGLTGPEANDEILTSIGRIRALQRTTEAPSGPARDAWVERLALTADW